MGNLYNLIPDIRQIVNIFLNRQKQIGKIICYTN